MASASPASSVGSSASDRIVMTILRTCSLPADPTPSKAHDLPFPFNIRLAMGGWKLLFFDTDWVVTGALTPEEIRGRYLVESLGHCGECHTPRNALGAMNRDQWLAGGPSPDGKGKFRTSRPPS